MKELFKNYDIELDENELKLFEKFLKIFMEKNSQINLSAIREENAIIEKHFIDSIILPAFWKPSGKVLDLWTWWGFPGIPLKIVSDDDVQFTLVDSIWKKVKVVNEFITELWLKNIKAIQARAEDLWQDKNHREKYDLVVSRATAYLPTLLEYTIPLLKVWWVFASYKLENEEEVKESQKALDVLNAEIMDKRTYTLAWQERVILFIQKIWETPKKYPRIIWEPLKNPIK